MKRGEKTEKLKEFLRLEKELRANWEAQRNLGYKPLEKPIPDGYRAQWVLREDVARREDADRFQYILDNFGKSVWCKRKDFKVWDYQIKKLVDVKPYFREITPKEYESLSIWAKKFFTEGQKYSRWGNYMYSYYYVNIPSHYLVPQVRRDYKTHYKVIDEILQQEEAELEARLDWDFYNERRARWKSHRSNKTWRKIFHRSDRSKTRQIIKRNVMNAKEGEHYNDSIELGLNKGSRCWW
jgi:hypothetical protein